MERGRFRLESPAPRHSFYDDAHVERYASAAWTYAGKHRRGARANISSALFRDSQLELLVQVSGLAQQK